MKFLFFIFQTLFLVSTLELHQETLLQILHVPLEFVSSVFGSKHFEDLLELLKPEFLKNKFF